MDMGVLPGYYPGGVALSEGDKIKEQWGENAPLKHGASAMEMIDKAASGEIKALVVYRNNPVVDFPGRVKIEAALKKLDLFVVHDMLETETSRLAHIVLPSNGPGYDEGTTTNIGGRVQYRRRGLNSKNHPDWKIISLMHEALGGESEYITSFSVTDEIAKTVPCYGEISKKSIKQSGKNRNPVLWSNGHTGDSIYSSSEKSGALRLRVAMVLFTHDKILDADSPLAHHFKPSTLHFNEADAKKLGLKDGDEAVLVSDNTEVRGVVEISNRCNPGGVVVPKVSDEQGVFGLADRGPVSWVEVRKA